MSKLETAFVVRAMVRRKTPKKTLSKVRRKHRKTLFYRNKRDQTSLVFAPPKVAEYNSAIHHALAASTRGEFKALIPPKEYKQLLKRLRDGEYDLDDDEDHNAHKHRNLPVKQRPIRSRFSYSGL